MDTPLPQPDASHAPHPAHATRSPVGIIAGHGRLPVLVAKGMKAAERKICVVGLSGQSDPELKRMSDQFAPAGMIQIGRWIRMFRRWGVTEAVMVGGVDHTQKYHRFQFLHYRPDWRAVSLWYRHLRGDRRTCRILTVLADELGRNGVQLIDNRTFIPDHMAGPGLMTRHEPKASLTREIDFGWPMLQHLVTIGAGQSIAVRACDVVAIEAAEGTDAMIRRAGELCSGRPWTFFKTCGQEHDMRADVATVGVQTIEMLHAAGARAMVLGTQRVIMLDKPDVLAAADRYGITIFGMQ